MTFTIWTSIASVALAAASPTPAQPTESSPSAAAAPAQAGSGDGLTATPEASLTAQPVVPPTADDDQKPPREKPGFGGTFVLDNSVPSGTFITNNAYNFNPAWSTNLYLRPSYTFKAWGLSLRAEVWENFTLYTILDKNSLDTRRLDWSDPRLTLYDDKIWEEPNTKITLAGFVRGSIPLSYQSQYETKITTLSAGVNLKKSFYRLTLSLGLSAGKNFNRQATSSIPCSATSVAPLGITAGSAPDISSIDVLTGFQNGECRPGAMNSAIGFTNVDFYLLPNGSASYKFTDKLTLTLSLYYFDEFKYPVPVDSFTPVMQSTTGQTLVGVGQARADGIWGITDLNYALTDQWSLGLGLWNGAGATGAPVKTNSGGGLRFPFLDTYALNSNDWILYFDVIASF